MPAKPGRLAARLTKETPMIRALLLACGAALLAALPVAAQPVFQLADPVVTTVTGLHVVEEETRHAVVLIDASAGNVAVVLREAKVGNILTLKRIDDSANIAVLDTDGTTIDGITGPIGVPAGANATLIHAGDGEWFVIEGRILGS